MDDRVNYSNGNSFSVETQVVLKPPVSVIQRSIAGGIMMAFPPRR